MIKIDGSFGEGGGSIVRIATALSLLTQKSVKIINIRKNRPQAGLKTQHLEAIKAISRLCGGELKGGNLGSTEIIFIPKKIKNKNSSINLSTAASTGLVLQALLLALVGKSTEIRIKGGATWNKWAPSISYLQNVLSFFLDKIGYKFKIKVRQHGFYPKGGSGILVNIKSAKKLKSLNLEKRDKLKYIEIISIASDMLKKAKVADRQADSAVKYLGKLGCKKIKREYANSLCPGSGILVYAVYDNYILGFDVVGERGKRSEDIGKEAALGLIRQINSSATVDKFMSDQLIPYMALADGDSIVKVPELTKHTKTNIWLVEKFLPVKFSIKDSIIECRKL